MIPLFDLQEKIPSFLSLFNLRLIDLYQIQEQDSNTLHIAIGVQHRIPQSCDVHNPNRESFENFVDILSTSTLLSLDYTELDRTFRKLRLIYGVGNSPSEVLYSCPPILLQATDRKFSFFFSFLSFRRQKNHKSIKNRMV